MLNRHVLFLVFLWHVVYVGYAEDWRQAAEKKGVSSEQIQELEQNKILHSDRRVSQIFSLYIEPRMPVFITSDSILNAYHVLLEESVLRLEQANSAKLPRILRFVWQNLETADQHIQGDPKLVAAAKARAQIVLGTAMKLLEEAPLQTDAETAALILAEVDRVTTANTILKPEWLGPSSDPHLVAIDYSRYRPRGFYDQTEGLSRYFRAVSWLQSIPFRLDNDEQLLAILMLGSGLADERLADDDAKREEFAAFFECFRDLLGDRDDWDLMTAASAVPPGLKLDLGSGDLEKVRSALESRAKATGHRPLINDQVSIQPGEIPLSLRVISAHRTPDAILFGQTTGIERPFPSGLEVCIALGSDYAKRRFEDPAKADILATIDESGDLFDGSSLYFDYMDCISALLDAPPPNAPAFMSRSPWKAKSCQTALAGWAQLRHTWSLQAKEVFAVSLGEEWEPPVGFVEPDPVFFARLEELARRTGRLLSRAGAEVNEDYYAIARLQNLLDVLESKAASGEGLDDRSSTGQRFADLALYDVMGRPSDKIEGSAAKEFLDRAIAKTKELLAQIQRGERSGKEYAGWGRWLWNRPVDELWTELAKVSARLRMLAEKQLNNERFDEEDRDFIVTYGRHLAPLMFHLPSPSATPRDDVPRIVTVVCDPSENEYLEVGVGRPQIIYVLYPTERGEVFCRGAILPYYEFLSPKRLTNVEWKQILDSSDSPAQPEWVTSFEGESDAPAQPERAPSVEAKSDVPDQPEKATSLEVAPWAKRVGILIGAAAAIVMALCCVGRRRRNEAGE